MLQQPCAHLGLAEVQTAFDQDVELAIAEPEQRNADLEAVVAQRIPRYDADGKSAVDRDPCREVVLDRG